MSRRFSGIFISAFILGLTVVFFEACDGDLKSITSGTEEGALSEFSKRPPAQVAPTVKVCLAPSDKMAEELKRQESRGEEPDTLKAVLKEYFFSEKSQSAYTFAECRFGVCAGALADCVAKNSYFADADEEVYGKDVLKRVGLLVLDSETKKNVGAEMRYETDTRGQVLFHSVGGPIASYNDISIHGPYSSRDWLRVVDVRFSVGANPGSMPAGYKSRTSATQVMSFKKASARWAALADFARELFVTAGKKFALSACSNGGEMVARSLLQQGLSTKVNYAAVNSGPALWDVNCFCSEGKSSSNGVNCPAFAGKAPWVPLLKEEFDYVYQTGKTCQNRGTHSRFAADGLVNDSTATWKWSFPSSWNVTVKRKGQGIYNSWTDTDFGLDGSLKATHEKVQKSSTGPALLREWPGPTQTIIKNGSPVPADGWIHCSYQTTETACLDLCTGLEEMDCAARCKGSPWITNPQDAPVAF